MFIIKTKTNNKTAKQTVTFSKGDSLKTTTSFIVKKRNKKTSNWYFVSVYETERFPYIENIEVITKA